MQLLSRSCHGVQHNRRMADLELGGVGALVVREVFGPREGTRTLVARVCADALVRVDVARELV